MIPPFAAKLRCAVSLCAMAVFSSSACVAQGAVAQLTIDTQDAGKPVSPMLYGLMTEEINHSYDGGLYAQLLSNHTFQGRSWQASGTWDLVRNGNAAASAEVDKNAGPSAALPTSLKLSVA